MSEKICFVIMPIGKDGSPTRERSNTTFEYIIEPAAEKCGYKAVRADKIDESGLISSQIIDHLLADPIVVADLTDHNPNVFYTGGQAGWNQLNRRITQRPHSASESRRRRVVSCIIQVTSSTEYRFAFCNFGIAR